MASDQAPEPADFFGPDVIAISMMMHLSLQSKRFQEGDFRAGWESAIEEAAACLDDQAGDDRATLQTLMEQVIGLMRGDYSLVPAKKGPRLVDLEHMEKIAEARARNRRADASPLPPPGSAAEAEMAHEIARLASVSNYAPSLSPPLNACRPRVAGRILRAAFAKGGESDGA